MFEERVVNKKPEEIWLIDWYANWCGPCQELAPEWRRLAKVNYVQHLIWWNYKYNNTFDVFTFANIPFN